MSLQDFDHRVYLELGPQFETFTSFVLPLKVTKKVIDDLENALG